MGLFQAEAQAASSALNSLHTTSQSVADNSDNQELEANYNVTINQFVFKHFYSGPILD